AGAGGMPMSPIVGGDVRRAEGSHDLQVDVRSRTVIIAARMNGLRSAEAAFVLRERFGRQRTRRSVLHLKMPVEEQLRIGCDHMFRQWSLLNQKEPPHVPGGELLRRVSVHA